MANSSRRRASAPIASAFGGNSGNSLVTIASVLNNPRFKQGMADLHKGISRVGERMVDGDYDRSLEYERGRQFAAATGLNRLEFNGSKASPEMIKRYVSLRQDGTIR